SRRPEQALHAAPSCGEHRRSSDRHLAARARAIYFGHRRPPSPGQVLHDELSAGFMKGRVARASRPWIVIPSAFSHEESACVILALSSSAAVILRMGGLLRALSRVGNPDEGSWGSLRADVKPRCWHGSARI